ncbi:MAG: cobalamin-dependent protein [Candidatus Lokiarchaeota archaeon]|nr:cobalamin-dependent protein [Candidatus Lokiarchaeota archaeon]
MSDDEILNKLKESVLDFDEDTAKEAAKEAIKAGIDPSKAIKEGLYLGLKEIADQYEDTYFITDMIIASDVFYAGANILKSKIDPEKAKADSKGTAVLGVVKGDVHDLGKNMVKYLFEAEGFKIIDLGFDVPAEKFVEEAEKNNADFILISLMLSSRFPEIGKIVNLAKEKKLQANGVKIMAGGGPVSEKIAYEQGADGWALTAPLAVKKALDLLK